jgi:hypothetical protein
MEKKVKYTLFGLSLLTLLFFTFSLIGFVVKSTILSSDYIEKVVADENVCQIISYNYDYFSAQALSEINQPVFTGQDIQKAMSIGFPADFIKSEIAVNSQIMENFLYGKSEELPIINLEKNKEAFYNELLRSSDYPNHQIKALVADGITQILPNDIKLSSEAKDSVNKYRSIIIRTNIFWIISVLLVFLFTGLVVFVVAKKTRFCPILTAGIVFFSLAFWGSLIGFVLSKSLNFVSVIIASSTNFPPFITNGIILPIINNLSNAIIAVWSPFLTVFIFIGLSSIYFSFAKSKKCAKTIKQVSKFKRKRKLFAT